MIPLRRWLLLSALGLALCTSLGEAKTKRRAKPARLRAAVGITWGSSLSLVAGYASRGRWLSAERAGPLLHKGTHLDIYSLETGRLGGLTLTNSGARPRSDPPGVAAMWGWDYTATAARDLPTVKADDYVAVWHAPGTRAPRWAKARALSPSNARYRRIVIAWLKTQCIPKDRCDEVVINQILQVDLNGDGRDEVLLSVYNWEALVYPEHPARNSVRKGSYSYVLLHYLPRGATHVRTVVIDRSCTNRQDILGCCDLDGDGWAEVITRDSYPDYFGYQLYHRAGRRYRVVTGCGSSL
jgi:hypothetical protein